MTSLRLCVIAAVFISAAASQSTTEAQLTVMGDIAAPMILKASELSLMPHATVSVPDKDGTKASYAGVPLREILKKAGVPFDKDLRGKALASYILAKAHDGYEVVFSLGELDAALGDASVLVADKRDGKPLFGNQGPLRLVCPNDKVGARSVRMLETLELVRLQK